MGYSGIFSQGKYNKNRNFVYYYLYMLNYMKHFANYFIKTQIYSMIPTFIKK